MPPALSHSDTVNDQMHCLNVRFSSPPSECDPCQVTRAYQTDSSVEPWVFLPQSAGNKAAPGCHRHWWRKRRWCNRNTCSCKWLIPSGSFQAWSLIHHFHLMLRYCCSHSTFWLCWVDNTPFMMRISGCVVIWGHPGRGLVPTRSQ